MAVEILNETVGRGFNPSNPDHKKRAMEAVTAKYGDGWDLQSYDPATGKATFWRQVGYMQVTASGTDSKEVDIPGVKPSDGDRVAAKLEADPENAGYVMTKFDPFLFSATLTKMTKESRRCRGAVANALRVKPWDVQVSDRKGGGFDIVLPPTYQPSKHDKALEEVATTIVGRPGWYVIANANKHTAQIIPGELPTFPPVAPYPITQLGKLTTDRTPFGIALGNPGEVVPRPVLVDWKGSAFTMVGGLPGGGKSVTINAIIAGWLAAGGEIVIVDIPDKKSDFTWVKPWVRKSGWGCESDLGALATLSLVYEEGKRRAKLNEELGVAGWRDIPAGQRPYKPLLVIVDEYAGLVVTEKIPAGVPKDNPVVQRKIMSNLVRVSIADVVERIMKEQRAMGMHMLVASQITNANSGLPPTVKGLIGNSILQGANPSKTQRAQAFSVEDKIPQIPQNVVEDAGASIGVGAAELAGQEPTVYKGFYASVGDYRLALEKLHLPTTPDPEPSPTDIARFDPTESGGGDDEYEPPSRLREEHGGYGRNERHGPREDGLSGAAAAAHDMKVQQAMFDREARNRAAAERNA